MQQPLIMILMQIQMMVHVNQLHGCFDSTAFNFDSDANIDDGSCIEIVLGCTDPTSFNYNSSANTDDDSCIPFIFGCTDELALNYDSEANTDDGTCIDPVLGCTDSEAANYDYLANVDDDSCLYEGCTNPDALNFDADADIDAGSCEIPGCIWNYWFICPSSYNPDATVGDWSYCEYIGMSSDFTASRSKSFHLHFRNFWKPQRFIFV